LDQAPGPSPEWAGFLCLAPSAEKIILPKVLFAGRSKRWAFHDISLVIKLGVQVVGFSPESIQTSSAPEYHPT